MRRPGVERFDFVVAGSGAGGAAVAAGLVEGGARVLLLERGGFASPVPDAADAVARYYAGAGYSTAFGNVLLPIPRGITVGGTTTINSGTCMRTPSRILARWERATSGALQAAEMASYVDAAWRRLRVARAPVATMSRASVRIAEGFARLGIGKVERLHRCAPGCTGEGRCCFVCPRGAKLTSYHAFVEPLLADERLRLETHAELVEVAVRRGGGVRVAARVRGRGSARLRTLAATCDALVLATGALESPWFARRLGRGACARRAGTRLSVHPAAKVFALFDEPVHAERGVPQGVGLDDPDDGAIRYEGVATPPELTALTMPLEGRRLRWWMDRRDRLATFGFMVRDEGRGRVRYPFGAGRPVVAYSLAERDRRRMLRAMRRVGEAFFAAGARRVLLPWNRTPNEFASAADLAAADLEAVPCSALQTMAFHPLGTCGIGRVVDANLALCPGVYVCDGSVVPEPLGVNPQITIYAFALRLAAHLLAR